MARDLTYLYCLRPVLRCWKSAHTHFGSGHCRWAGGNAGRILTAPWGSGHCMLWSRQQMGVNRYNCADSLDRTNVATFFIAAQVRHGIMLVVLNLVSNFFLLLVLA